MNKPKIRFKGFEGEWKEMQFEVAFEYQRNNNLSRAELSDEGIVANIHYGDVLIKYGECLDVSKDVLTYVKDKKISMALYKKGALRNGDVIFADAAEDNTVGKCTEVICEENVCIVSGLHTIACRPQVEIVERYLGYSLNSPSFHNQLLPHIQGTKISSISKNALSSTSISLPSLPEQRALASYFTSLDAQIAASTSRLSSLKQIKAASLLNMFPQKGESVPRVRFKGFQGEWKEKALGDVVDDFKYGINAAAVSYDGENKYLRITDIDEESRAFIKDELTSPDVDLSSRNEYIMQEGDIVIARTGASVGKSYIYHPIDGKVYFAGFLIRARVNKKVDREFVYLNTLTDGFKKYIRFVSQRSGQPGVNVEELKSYLMNLPASLPEQRAIASFFTALDAQITLQRERLEKLKQIKAACLEKMFA